MNLPAAILAGGLATRLRPLTETAPKALIEVAGRPFVAHQMELMHRNGIERVVLCVGHLGELIQAAVGDGHQYGLHVDYSFDGATLLGTGGALRRALPLLGDAFFVLYGDSYLDCDYQQARGVFERSGKLGLMTVYRNDDRWDRSNVLFVDGRIERYDKTHPTPDMHHIDYGLSILTRAAFEETPPCQRWDVADLYRSLIARGELAGYEVTRRFYEVGSPAGLQETRSYLAGQQAV
jgi:prepilin-type processing-associated H-X9-DG protein